MNKKKDLRSRRDEGYYKRQFARTEANKIRRMMKRLKKRKESKLAKGKLIAASREVQA